ncbi:MAG TPA: hypothetical protein VI814_05125 [Candidatus Limnocylindria bacterium]
MRLFRSEEHARRGGSGDVLTLEQTVGLARAWYARKLAPDWRRHTADEAEALFASLRLDPTFWRLR